MNEADAQSIRDAGRGHLLGAADGGSPPVTRADVNAEWEESARREREWEAEFRPLTDDDLLIDPWQDFIEPEDRDYSPDEFDEGEGDFID